MGIRMSVFRVENCDKIWLFLYDDYQPSYTTNESDIENARREYVEYKLGRIRSNSTIAAN